MESKIYFQKHKETAYTHTEVQGGKTVTQDITPDTVLLSDFNNEYVKFALLAYDYKPIGEIKEPYKNEWHDEHGDEEYIPDELMLEAYEVELTIGCMFTTMDSTTPVLVPPSVTTQIKRLINYFRCGGEFMFLIEECGLGRRNVRFQSYEDDARIYHQRVLKNGKKGFEDILQFKVTLKVNDPDYIVQMSTVIIPGNKRLLH